MTGIPQSCSKSALSVFFCLGRLCRLIAVGHAVRHSESNNYQRVKQMPLSVAQLPEPLSMVPPEEPQVKSEVRKEFQP